MVFSDGEIVEAIEQGRIVIDPVLSPDDLDEQLTTTALDLRLGPELHFYKGLDEVAPQGLASPVSIDPTKKGVLPDLIQKWGRRHSIADGYFDLPPQMFVLGATLESVSLPVGGRIAARVEGKSTMARLGFVAHMTAPTIHCGFSGHIVLEMFNFGPYTIRLVDGMRVCQLIFEEVGKAPRGGQVSQYQGQAGPAS